MLARMKPVRAAVAAQVNAAAEELVEAVVAVAKEDGETVVRNEALAEGDQSNAWKPAGANSAVPMDKAEDVAINNNAATTVLTRTNGEVLKSPAVSTHRGRPRGLRDTGAKGAENPHLQICKTAGRASRIRLLLKWQSRSPWEHVFPASLKSSSAKPSTGGPRSGRSLIF